MTELKIDRSKLLGFRLLSEDSSVAQDVKLGAKVGLKPTSPSTES